MSETRTEVDLEVFRQGEITADATINYATRDGAARAGEHYEAESGTLTFAPLDIAALGGAFCVSANTRGMRTHALPGAPAAPAEVSWPIALYSHGHQTLGAENTRRLENLASHGFAVVERVWKLGGVLQREILAAAKAARPEHPVGGL